MARQEGGNLVAGYGSEFEGIVRLQRPPLNTVKRETDPSTPLGISPAGLPLGFATLATLTPAKRLDKTDPSTPLGISPAGLPLGFATLATLTPAKRLDKTDPRLRPGSRPRATAWPRSARQP